MKRKNIKLPKILIKDKSFILEGMEEEYNKFREFNYQLYYSCKKYCDAYGVEQLNHAKAVLEQKKQFSEENNMSATILLALVSTGFMVVTLIVSAMTEDNKKKIDIDFLIIFGLLYFGCVVLVFIFQNVVSRIRRRNSYFHSIICDEIERRNK